jgi:AcrR family transcriptional regulator
MLVGDRSSISETRRTQILEAAVRVIGDRGLCDSRISDIARMAGTSSALVVYYFGSKDRLLAQALSYSEERFHAETARELAAIPAATERLVRLIELCCGPGREVTTWLDEWVLWLDLWSKAFRDPEVARDRHEMDRRWRTTIADVVRRGQRSGEFSTIDADDFAIRLASLIDGLAIQVVLGDPDVSANRMFDMCVAMSARELGFDPPAPGTLRRRTEPDDQTARSGRRGGGR